MRSRNVDIIVYDEVYLDKFITICEVQQFDYAYILHDKDLDDDDNIKKFHYHFRVFSDLQRSLSAWSKVFDYPINYIEKLDDKRLSIRYLIHADNREKYQYNQNDIITNIDDIEKYFKDTKQEESYQLKYICDYIDSINGYIYFQDVKNYVLENNYWSAYRRYYTIIRDIILERNKYCIDYMLK